MLFWVPSSVFFQRALPFNKHPLALILEADKSFATKEVEAVSASLSFANFPPSVLCGRKSALRDCNLYFLNRHVLRFPPYASSESFLLTKTESKHLTLRTTPV